MTDDPSIAVEDVHAGCRREIARLQAAVKLLTECLQSYSDDANNAQLDIGRILRQADAIIRT